MICGPCPHNSHFGQGFEYGSWVIRDDSTGTHFRPCKLHLWVYRDVAGYTVTQKPQQSHQILVELVQKYLQQDGPSMISAIKELRYYTGWSLKESKDFVEAVKSAEPVSLIAPTSVVNGVIKNSSAVSNSWLKTPPCSYEQFLEVLDIVAEGGVNKLTIIAKLRERTGWGLIACKDTVDRLTQSVVQLPHVNIAPVHTGRKFRQ